MVGIGRCEYECMISVQVPPLQAIIVVPTPFSLVRFRMYHYHPSRTFPAPPFVRYLYYQIIEYVVNHPLPDSYLLL